MDPVAICNLALGWVGAKLIASLDNNSAEAKLCKANFEAARDAVFEERAWTFATGRLEIAPQDISAADLAAIVPYAARFELPATVARVLSCDDGSGCGRLEWAREGQNIVSDKVDKLYVRAILRIDDVARWSPGFCQAVAARLAAELAIPLAQDRPLQADLWQLYERKLRSAGTLDGMQGRSEQTRSNYFADRRK